MKPQVLHLLSFLISAGLALMFTPIMRVLARKSGVVDMPDGLKRHRKPTPYLGGVAIYLAFMLSLVCVMVIRRSVESKLLGLIVGGTIICGLGVLDDYRRLSVWTKLFGQLVAAVVLVISGLRLEIVYLSFPLNVALSILWIVGITNALNLIDIMDGLAASVAFVASATFFFIAVPTGDLLTAVVSAALAGACIGFVGYNWHPASIFMGDAGSLFLGFMLAGVSISTSYTATNNIALLSPLLILAIPIYDTFYVSILRMAKRKSPFRGSRDHFALRLKAIGLRDQHVVVIVCLISLVLCEASYIATTVSLFGAIFIYIVTFFVFVMTGRLLSKVEP
ncbi:undecaprenyl/decaprenyl-phosphate alpha-N-acetylglucosaminyl 1-phosphate transferase [candidate division TA06 bacterium]|uniref:Undecaprenyl/decaprenyl-phosphate alpha-N-acetylglucosaminyl 1-phosphate transferase n=1 Tax=candidate division TA06 bacterium TaxID=2250710 RepID=A0A523XVC4_UNCT6|nr:MAG: undecaprenyl/decaprenyl-phosphate alpha-N-acetylglucosaminyl 1-phosphate transferase [candidate division TA06 bacterium]